ncbi:MAG: hypothetical protein LR011_05145, partial [Verrucomicrobia bacterium]|nr:hypothetical protein [Verrucomicrobiota bacterium]
MRVDSVGRGVTTLETRVERTDASGVKEVFTDEVELLVAPLDSEVIITSGEHLLNQTPEDKWGARARAINDKRRKDKLTPFSNLIEIQLTLTNKSKATVENMNIPDAINILSLISSTDIQSPGVPLKPIQFYAPDGSTIDLTNPESDPTIEDVSLAPDESVVYAWVVDAFDANPAPEEDDSADLEFRALVLGSIDSINLRELATAEFKVIDQPLLEWGIRPKGGRTTYQSGQVVRVDGYIENISTRDSKPPQDIRVMVYQVPEGNIGGGFMFDNAKAGGPTPKYYEIFELPAEGPGKVKNLSAVFRSFPTVKPSGAKVRFGVRLWTVKPNPD